MGEWNPYETPLARSILGGELSARLAKGISGLGYDLSKIPELLKQVIEMDLWRDFKNKLEIDVHHDRFIDYVTDTRPLCGLGTDLRTLKNLCRDDPEALDLIDRVKANPVGTNQHSEGEGSEPLDNIQELKAPTGTSREAALRRLRKDRPDLHALVIERKLSAHAAMVEAGFRKKPSSMEVIKNHIKKLDRAEIDELIGFIEKIRLSNGVVE